MYKSEMYINLIFSSLLFFILIELWKINNKIQSLEIFYSLFGVAVGITSAYLMYKINRG